MRPALRWLAFVLSSLASAGPVWAAHAGWRQIAVASAAPDAAPIQLVLYYPTQVPARAVVMGSFAARVSVDATPDAATKGLIVLSHGRGGTEIGYSSLAEALAQHGYLVAALRHPGDNWQDSSLLRASPVRYFSERPQHVSRVIDSLLRDPDWGPRIGKDARGPRIGVLGHSAGAYTALALAGARPEIQRIVAHCMSHRIEDPIFCGVGGDRPTPTGTLAPPPQPLSGLADTRVRAIVALAPPGVLFSAESLAQVRVPTALYEAEQDRYLVSRFHAQWIAKHLPGVEHQRIANAWHFAFMDTPTRPIATEDGDIGADPPGFDRPAFLSRLRSELITFFDKALR
jgi:predicted dienelactone hydrolase